MMVKDNSISTNLMNNKPNMYTDGSQAFNVVQTPSGINVTDINN